MSYAAKTLLIFSVYLATVAALFVIVPNVLLEFLGLPSTHEVWIRIVGMCLGGLAFYYAVGALQNITPFIQLTVYARSLTIFFFSGLVLLGLTQPVVIVFGVIDLLGAIWTEIALRSDARR
jgi:hypothetical protein